MLREIDNFYLQKKEPIKSCLIALKGIILEQDKDITEAWKYGMPFFCYKEEMFCYLRVHKKYHQPYIGIAEGKYFNHSFLLREKRSRMKIMLVAPTKNLPLKTIATILKQGLRLYKSGNIKIRK